ncbi:hypothetical protein AOLI_G00323200 [Acnodon oligacanthus]
MSAREPDSASQVFVPTVRMASGREPILCTPVEWHILTKLETVKHQVTRISTMVNTPSSRVGDPPLSPSQSAQGSSNNHAVLLPVCDHEKIKDSRRLSDSSTVDSAAQLPTNPSDPPQTD